MTYKLICLVVLVFPSAIAAQNGPALSATGTPLPAWRAFFHQVENLKAAARSASPGDAAELAQWQQKRIGITDQEAAQVQQIAATHIAAIAAVDKQATRLIQEQAAQFPGGRLPSKDALPAPLPALGQLQQQRDTLTLSHIHSLQASVGVTSFSKIDAWIKSNFSQQVKKPAASNVRPPASSMQGGKQ